MVVLRAHLKVARWDLWMVAQRAVLKADQRVLKKAVPTAFLWVDQ
jgi:hypothetical protein